MIELKKMLRKSLLFALLVPVAVLVMTTERSEAQSAPDVEILLTTETSELLIGELVSLTLQVRHPAGYQVIIPQLSRNWGGFEIRNQSRPETEINGDGRETTSQIIEATLFSLGELETPELPITMRDLSGQIIREMAPVLSVNVVPTVSENDGELRDIRSQADLPPQSLLPLIVSASVVGALLISLLIWVTYLLIERKVLSPRRSARALDTRSPYEAALDELANIETLDLPAQRSFKEHYARVADSIRRFLEGAYDVSAFGKTTDELDAALEDSPLNSDDSRQVIDFLKNCDLIKFASVDMEAESVRQSTSQARDLLDLITPATAWTGRGR